MVQRLGTVGKATVTLDEAEQVRTKDVIGRRGGQLGVGLGKRERERVRRHGGVVRGGGGVLAPAHTFRSGRFGALWRILKRGRLAIPWCIL